ncbi:type VII secretion protein EccB, partial [Corynebacterium phoceense]
GFAWPTGGLVPLVGESVATHFGGLDAGGVAVDTGHGRLVVSATGTRHAVPSQAEWEALGLRAAASAPWDIVRLLPEGSELSRAAALNYEGNKN